MGLNATYPEWGQVEVANGRFQFGHLGFKSFHILFIFGSGHFWAGFPWVRFKIKFVVYGFGLFKVRAISSLDFFEFGSLTFWCSEVCYSCDWFGFDINLISHFFQLGGPKSFKSQHILILWLMDVNHLGLLGSKHQGASWADSKRSFI